MRRKWIGLVVFGLAIATPAADNTKPATPAPAKKVVGPAVVEVAEKLTAGEGEKASPREASAVELELQKLKQMIQDQGREIEAQRAALREQQQKMEGLAAELREARAREEALPGSSSSPVGASVALGAAAQNQEELGAKVRKIEKELSDTKKSMEGKLKGFGPFSFSGDLRVRYEPFFGGGAATAPAPPDRHRERIRLRFNANARFSDEFSGGLTIASGDPGDPVSTNQTLTNFFQRKPFLIDKAFVQYTPRWFKPFTVTAGKWGYTWYRTELTWDNDLNPEGVSEAVTFSWKDSVLQRLGFVAFQMPFNEVSSGPDSGIFGGQIQTVWKLHDRVKFGAYAAYYHYRNANSIAANQVGSGSTGTTGSLSGNNDTNAFGLIGGTRQFASKFGILDAIARFDIDTGIDRFPMALLFDFTQNTRACANIGAFTAAGVTRPACNPRDRQAYWAEVQFGRTQEQGDMRFGYTFIRIEREAVVSAFNFSDIRQATNVANHRMDYLYQLNKNVQMGFTGLIGRQLVTSASATPERFLKRLQFDLIYKF